MARYPGKRKSDTVDSTEDRAPKSSRTTPYLEPQGYTTGQRFGEDADFIPLNQLSQVAGADEDDAEAADVIPDTQDEAESSLTTNILYGKTLAPNSYFLLRVSYLNIFHRHASNKDRGRPFLQRPGHSRRACGVGYLPQLDPWDFIESSVPNPIFRLQRDPGNQYDRNAIQVNNVMGAQIGHIPRQVAAKLAGYMVHFTENLWMNESANLAVGSQRPFRGGYFDWRKGFL